MSVVIFVMTSVILLASMLSKTDLRWNLLGSVILINLTVFPASFNRNAFDLVSGTNLVIVVAGMALLARGRFYKTLLLFAPFLIIALLLQIYEWHALTSSLLNYAVYLLAWVVGMRVSQSTHDSARNMRWFAWTLLIVVVVQTGVTSLQAMGVPIFQLEGVTAELESGRANGTMDHPGTLGKVLMLIAVLALPATLSADVATRRIASVAVWLALVPIALTASRSNFIAYLAVVLVWAVIQPASRRFGGRLVLPMFVGVVALIFVDQIIQRFLADPSGGQREHFTIVTLEYLPRVLWTGVGPGKFTSYFGQFDALIAQNWPVHHVGLLLLSELGLLGVVAFLIPVIVVFVRALRGGKAAGVGDARALLALMPSLILVSVTGWGLMYPNVFTLLMFLFGYFSFSLQSASKASQAPGEPVGRNVVVYGEAKRRKNKREMGSMS
ncbi:O-antigen ligase [Pseudoclavibacter sp. RFBB5]|uniref:O-antigen ligase family protein n=1 Tax=Pseudoclavibacter sp. RFBB5 TaxID=2080574 RepID=UPI000CE7AA15|nr:O-antigen ligase family protein [Pseudoclavibacter sp. RFBB5]PPG33465.1 hypothetical protein C5B97_02350 [Pseudoclavibacter sp. RFBB5]